MEKNNVELLHLTVQIGGQAKTLTYEDISDVEALEALSRIMDSLTKISQIHNYTRQMAKERADRSKKFADLLQEVRATT